MTGVRSWGGSFTVVGNSEVFGNNAEWRFFPAVIHECVFKLDQRSEWRS